MPSSCKQSYQKVCKAWSLWNGSSLWRCLLRKLLAKEPGSRQLLRSHGIVEDREAVRRLWKLQVCVIVIYVLFGSNEVGEDFLVLQVFVKIFRTFETFSMFLEPETKSRVETSNENVKNVKKKDEAKMIKLKRLTKFNTAKIKPA